ncbi:hypothetical protein [Actinopolymorpha pittospori]
MAQKPPSAAYRRRRDLFVQAIEIAIELRDEIPDSETMIKFANELKDMAFGKYPPEVATVSPDPPRLTVAGLRYLEEAFFTYWYEATGPHIDHFWRLVAERDLPYQRKDHIAAVLARGRIRTGPEYDAVIDNLVVLQQLGRLTPADADKLVRAIDKYEGRSGG